MVTDRQVRRLMMLINQNQTLSQAASKAKMDEKKARKYLKSGKFPSQLAPAHRWRTHEDAFEEVWSKVEHFFENPGVEAKAVLLYFPDELSFFRHRLR